MAESEADIGYGVVLKKGDGGSPTETFADFGLEITSADAPTVSRATQDATHMASPSRATEVIAGLLTAKPFNVEFNWIPANTQDIQDEVTGAAANWQMDFGDGTTCTIKCLFTDFTVGGLTPDGKRSGSATLTPKSGLPVWA